MDLIGIYLGEAVEDDGCPVCRLLEKRECPSEKLGLQQGGTAKGWRENPILPPTLEEG